MLLPPKVSAHTSFYPIHNKITIKSSYHYPSQDKIGIKNTLATLYTKNGE